MAAVAHSTDQPNSTPGAIPPPLSSISNLSFISNDTGDMSDESSIDNLTEEDLPASSSKTKQHPLHSNNSSLGSADFDDTVSLPPLEPSLTTRPSRSALGQMRSLSAKDVTSETVRSTSTPPRILARSQSYRSAPKLAPKISIHGLRVQGSQPLPPALTSAPFSGMESPASSVRMSIRSSSPGNRSISSTGVAALAGLRNMLAQDQEPKPKEAEGHRRSLFDEVSFNSAPGNLHLLSDDSIRRFVGRYGTVSVVRQLAADLAQRESEVILVRKQQEDRERELKKLLAQCGVSMADVDKRLLNMTATSVRRPKEVLDELIYQAINEEQDLSTAKDETNDTNDNDKKINDSNDIKTSQSNSMVTESKTSTSAPTQQPSKRRSWAMFFLGGTSDDKKTKAVYPESIISEDDTESLYSTDTNAHNSLAAPLEDSVDKGSILSAASNKYSTVNAASPAATHRNRSSSQAFNPAKWIPESIKDHVPQVQAPPTPVNDRRPVELDNIVPQSIQPPTLLPSWNNHYGLPDRYLTDRFGFIYDRHKDSSPIAQTIVPEDAPLESLKKENTSESPVRASVKVIEDKETGILVMPPNQFQPEVIPQNATAMITKSVHSQPAPSIGNKGPNSVRMLLAQLTDMHDILQKAQTVRWDEFLGKLNSTADAEPSEFIQNGTELIGVSGAGLAGGDDVSGFSFSLATSNAINGSSSSKKKKTRSSKEGKQLWREFKTLVLGGVPVTYRAKIWGECSGARTLKTPGVYQSLVDREDESEALNQIDLDLYRTMPYNVFFGSTGPGVHKLRRVLVAFARRNPEVGYCQGSKYFGSGMLLKS